MPNRIIKESICTSETVDKMTWFEECFWHRLIVNCDDYGCMDARPKILKAKLFPLKDRLTVKDIEDALHKLADMDCVRLYECDSKPYLYLPSWEVHQTVRAKKRKYPDPNNVKSSEIICKQMHADDPVIQSNPIQSESNPNTNTDPKAAHAKKQKHRYGEYKNVLLTDEDVEKLKKKFPQDWENRIEQLSQGIELKGYSYKNHYLAVLKWAERDFKAGNSHQEQSAPSYDLDEYEKQSIFDD